MAIVYLDGGRITGLSTDAKPDRAAVGTTYNAAIPAVTVQAGSLFIETDTGARYVHNGTAWIQQTFDSINDALGKSGGDTQHLHFVEWFTGKQYFDDQWQYNLLNGTGGQAMADEINGGFTMNSTATGGTSESILTWNNINQINNLGATFICVAKSTTSGNALSNMETRGGFKLANNDTFGSGQHAGFKTNTGNVNFSAYTASASGTTATDVGVYHDTSLHVWKGELIVYNATQANKFLLSLDGIHRATITTNTPTVALQPYLYHYGYQPNAGSCTSSFNYYEAWNH